MLPVSEQLWLQKVSVILWSYPNAITKPSVSVIINLRCGDSVCLFSVDFVSGSNIKIWNNAQRMLCTAGADSMGTAWEKLRVPLAHLLHLFLGIFGSSLSITQLYGRNEHGSGLDRTGSGLKSDCNFFENWRIRTGSDWENIFCFNVIILNVSKILVVLQICWMAV